MSWMLVINAIAGVAGVASVAYLAWATWVCVHGSPLAGRTPKGRVTRRHAASAGRLRGRFV